MVVNAVGEKYPLGIYFEIPVIFAVPVSGVVSDNLLEGLPQSQIPGAVLVPIDVTAPFGGLCQMIHILLLLQAEPIPSRDSVSYDLEVREFIQKVAEAFFLILVAGNHTKRTESYHRCQFDYTFHCC